MFQRANERLQRALSLFDDVLGDPPPEATPHPHRRALRWQPERRPGAVPARSEYCLCPVGTAAPAPATVSQTSPACPHRSSQGYVTRG